MCSVHFIDGVPTVRLPFQEPKLGYDKKIPQPRKDIVKHPVGQKKTKKHIAEETVQASPPFRNSTRNKQKRYPEFPPKHQYCLLPGRKKCSGYVYKEILIQKYHKKLSIW